MTDQSDDPAERDAEPAANDEPPGEGERADEGMAPLVTNTGDDDDEGAASG